MKVINDASLTGVEYVKWKVEREGGQGRATWSLFLLLSRIPISRVIAVGYVSSRHFLLSSHRGFGVDLGAIQSTNPYIYYFPIFPRLRATYLLDLSIDAPDWNTLYAAEMARNMKLPGDEKWGEVDEQTYVFQPFSQRKP